LTTLAGTWSIGRDFFDWYASQHALTIERGGCAALVRDFHSLASSEFNAD
jgi:hypothetical protein